MSMSLKARLGTIGRVVVLVVFVSGCTEEVKTKPQVPSAPQGLTNRTLDVYVLGIREPKTVPANESTCKDSDIVIGVSVDGAYRAYQLDALRIPLDVLDASGQPPPPDILKRHVVNDLVGKHPVTVTFCDETSCVRTFTAKGTQSLDVAVGGWDMDNLVLLINGKRFKQNADDLPLDDLEFQKTTWGEWKASHPTTDIYEKDFKL